MYGARVGILVLALLVAPGVGVKLRGVATPAHAGEKDAAKLLVAGAEPKKAEGKKEEKKVAKKDEKKEGKKDEKKDGKKKDKKKEGPCDEANALKKKVEKMEATDKKFFGKVMELKDLASACRAEKGKAAQKKADKKYKKKELGKANEMPKEHDPDTKKGQLNGTAVAKTTKKVEKESKAIDKTGFEGGKKGKGGKKDGKKADKKGEKKEKKKSFLQVDGEPKKEEKKKEEKKEAKKGDKKKGEKDGKKAEKKDKKKDSKCGEADALSKKIGKMEATDKKFFGKVMELKDLASACRAEKGKAAQKKADKKYKKKELGKANAMPKEHDPDTKKGQLNGTSVAKVEKKVKAQTKEIDSTGFEGGKKGKKAAGKKGDKKGEKKEEKKKAKKALIQTSACVTQDLEHRAQLQNKLAGVCVDMCKEVGAFPKCTCPDFVAPDSTPGVMTWPELLEHLDNLSEWGHGQLKAWTKQASQLQIEGTQSEKACLADDLKHRVQVQNKLAGVCVDMCKEVGAFPKCTCPDFVAPDSTPGVMTWPELLEHMDNLSEWGHGELKAWTNVAR